MSHHHRPYDAGQELRLRRLAEQLHALGPVANLHLLRELTDDNTLEIALKRYARLDGAFIAAVGGGSFPAPMLRVTGAA